MRAQQTQNFYKSLHMLQANTMLRESDSSTPFEDYSIYMYRQSAPEFGDRVKELERKLMYPVSREMRVCLFAEIFCHTVVSLLTSSASTFGAREKFVVINSCVYFDASLNKLLIYSCQCSPLTHIS